MFLEKYRPCYINGPNKHYIDLTTISIYGHVPFDLATCIGPTESIWANWAYWVHLGPFRPFGPLGPLGLLGPFGPFGPISVHRHHPYFFNFAACIEYSTVSPDLNRKSKRTWPYAEICYLAVARSVLSLPARSCTWHFKCGVGYMDMLDIRICIWHTCA